MSVVHSITGRPGRRIFRLVELLKARQVAKSFLNARKHTASESERIAYALDARLVMHPELVATNDDYPGWTPGGRS
jgi:hypothetical protein